MLLHPAVLPPGKFMSQGLVRLCPQGYYREDYVQFDAANGTVCLPCRPGITTAGPGAGAASLCNVVVDGHGIAAINNVTGPQNIPALPTDLSNGGLPEAPVCDFGYYSFDGYCAQCPSATVTRSRGAKSIEECSECHAPCPVCESTPSRANSCSHQLFGDPRARLMLAWHNHDRASGWEQQPAVGKRV